MPKCGIDGNPSKGLHCVMCPSACTLCSFQQNGIVLWVAWVTCLSLWGMGVMPGELIGSSNSILGIEEEADSKGKECEQKRNWCLLSFPTPVLTQRPPSPFPECQRDLCHVFSVTTSPPASVDLSSHVCPGLQECPR